MNKIINENKGILDPEGKKLNPLTNSEYTNRYFENVPKWVSLPVYKEAKKIMNLIKDNQVLLLTSGTGSGKSVLVPKFALHLLNYKGKVVITNPKKIPVMDGAEFAAKTLDVELGNEVGFQFRGAELANGKRAKSKNTKLLYSTDGSIVAQLINDPELKEYDVVIVDEAHERTVQIDLLLLLLKKALVINKNLKLIIMSATVNKEIFRNYFENDVKFAEIDVSGKTNFPVETYYLDKQLANGEKDFLEAGVNQIIEIMKSGKEGDILFFINSLDQAKQGCNMIREAVKKNGLKRPFCIELGSGVSKEAKDYAIKETLYKNHPNGPFTRKIVMGTNTVEAAVTIDGLVFVIDSGYAFVDSYVPEKYEQRLLVERISKAQAKQRAGRAGRNKPGVCFRLYTKNEYEEFRDYPVFAIEKSDLTSDLLKFLTLPYIKNVQELLTFVNEFITPPKQSFVKSALFILHALGLITLDGNKNGELTELGRRLGESRKLDPRYGKMLIEANKLGILKEMVDVVTILGKADGRLNTILKDYKPNPKLKNDQAMQKKEKDNYTKIKKALSHSYGDILTLYKIYIKFDDFRKKHTPEQTEKWCEKYYLNYGILSRLNKRKMGILEELKKNLFTESGNYIKNELRILYNENDDKKSGQKGGQMKIEDKIMRSVISGWFINMAKLKDKFNYENCFPQPQYRTTASISRDSVLSLPNTKLPTYIVYGELTNIFGNEKYNLATKVPSSVILELSAKDRFLIKSCFEKSEKAVKYKNIKSTKGIIKYRK